jgi:hypothetical protein
LMGFLSETHWLAIAFTELGAAPIGHNHYAVSFVLRNDRTDDVFRRIQVAGDARDLKSSAFLIHDTRQSRAFRFINLRILATAQPLILAGRMESKEHYVAKEICGLHASVGRKRHVMGPERSSFPTAARKFCQPKFNKRSTGIRSTAKATACMASRSAISSKTCTAPATI